MYFIWVKGKQILNIPKPDISDTLEILMSVCYNRVLGLTTHAPEQEAVVIDSHLKCTCAQTWQTLSPVGLYDWERARTRIMQTRLKTRVSNMVKLISLSCSEVLFFFFLFGFVVSFSLAERGKWQFVHYRSRRCDRGVSFCCLKRNWKGHVHCIVFCKP